MIGAVALAVAATFSGLGIASGVTSDVTLTVDGVSVTVRTTAETVADLLITEGVLIDVAMVVEPAQETHVYDGMSVAVSYPHGVTAPKYVELTVDGATHHFTTYATTVSSLLFQRSVKVGPDDRVNVDRSTQLSEGMRITVQRVEVREEAVSEEIAFSTNRRYTTDLAPGETKVLIAGVPGIRTIRSQVTYVDGVEESRIVLSDELTREPTLEQLEVGLGSLGYVTPGSAQDIAKGLVPGWGWDDNEFQCLVNLWQRESNWRVNAENEWSGAYGIPQALPGDKMAAAGDDWRTNPETQIRWGLGYIANRYNTPCGAWEFFLDRNWY
jgi:uncharacterized protein YabE (DUF348 family)